MGRLTRPGRAGRGGHRWRKLQARVYRTETHCALCGNHVDQQLPWPHPMSKSVDHIISVYHRPDLALERTNVQLAHLKCNRDKGTGEPKLLRTPVSREW